MEIKIVKSNRKTMSLTVDDELNAVIRAPYFVTDREIEKFVTSHQKWLEEAVIKKQTQLEKYNLAPDEIAKLKVKAVEYIKPRVEYYAALMNVKPTGLKITTAKKRFGSCSSKNSLCFSCILMLYPPDAIDYVIVHELAHIRHHNHSKSFYAFVAEYMPDYKERERLLKHSDFS